MERRKPVLKRKHQYNENVISVLGKRKLDEVFGAGMNDDNRYGCEIPPDFFNSNIGHIVYTKKSNEFENVLKYWYNKYNTKLT
jgi:hypothetical protein